MAFGLRSEGQEEVSLVGEGQEGQAEVSDLTAEPGPDLSLGEELFLSPKDLNILEDGEK